MLLSKFRTLLIAAAMLPCFLQPASAHVIWFDYDNGEYDVLFGHPEEGPESYNPSRFQEAIVYDINKQPLSFNINQTSDGVSLNADGNVAAIQAFFDNGYFSIDSNNQYTRIEEGEISNYPCFVTLAVV